MVSMEVSKSGFAERVKSAHGKVDRRSPEHRAAKRRYNTAQVNNDLAIAGTAATTVPLIGHLAAKTERGKHISIPPAQAQPAMPRGTRARLKGAQKIPGVIGRAARHPGTTAAIGLAAGAPVVIANQREYKEAKAGLAPYKKRRRIKKSYFPNA